MPNDAGYNEIEGTKNFSIDMRSPQYGTNLGKLILQGMKIGETVIDINSKIDRAEQIKAEAQDEQVYNKYIIDKKNWELSINYDGMKGEKRLAESQRYDEQFDVNSLFKSQKFKDRFRENQVNNYLKAQQTWNEDNVKEEKERKALIEETDKVALANSEAQYSKLYIDFQKTGNLSALIERATNIYSSNLSKTNGDLKKEEQDNKYYDFLSKATGKSIADLKAEKEAKDVFLKDKFKTIANETARDYLNKNPNATVIEAENAGATRAFSVMNNELRSNPKALWWALNRSSEANLDYSKQQQKINVEQSIKENTDLLRRNKVTYSEFNSIIDNTVNFSNKHNLVQTGISSILNSTLDSINGGNIEQAEWLLNNKNVKLDYSQIQSINKATVTGAYNLAVGQLQDISKGVVTDGLSAKMTDEIVTNEFILNLGKANLNQDQINKEIKKLNTAKNELYSTETKVSIGGFKNPNKGEYISDNVVNNYANYLKEKKAYSDSNGVYGLSKDSIKLEAVARQLGVNIDDEKNWEMITTTYNNDKNSVVKQANYKTKNSDDKYLVGIHSFKNAEELELYKDNYVINTKDGIFDTGLNAELNKDQLSISLKALEERYPSARFKQDEFGGLVIIDKDGKKNYYDTAGANNLYENIWIEEQVKSLEKEYKTIDSASRYYNDSYFDKFKNRQISKDELKELERLVRDKKIESSNNTILGD